MMSFNKVSETSPSSSDRQTDTQRDTQTERQTVRQTHRQTQTDRQDTQTDRQRDTQTERQTVRQSDRQTDNCLRSLAINTEQRHKDISVIFRLNHENVVMFCSLLDQNVYLYNVL